MLAFVEVPQHGITILASGSTQGSIRRYSDTVQVTGVTEVVGLQLTVRQVPNLDLLVPAAGHNDWVGSIWREPHTGHPVAMTLILDGVFADTKGIPEFDSSVWSQTQSACCQQRRQH